MSDTKEEASATVGEEGVRGEGGSGSEHIASDLAKTEKGAVPSEPTGLDDGSQDKTALADDVTGSGKARLEGEVRTDGAKLEKPSPLSLPIDLLNSHPADSLHPPDSPTTSLISSLRAQLSILSDQSVALNQKLISSISRSADLEDELHELQASHITLTTKAKDLQGEKERWEDSMNTGLLVERSQIKDEMQRLAAGLVEEERRRGSAEERREQVENEVDDLTAKLFDQANTMVAVERMSRIEAEGRLKHTEDNLAAAEAAVRDMQLHLQSLAPSSAQSTSTSLLPHTAGPSSTMVRKYISSHTPYSEFLSFIAHLRSLRPIKEISKNTFPPPLVTNLLTQPFLARTINEDHDPALRLDIAPDLSWLSRRGVGQAIFSGDLIIEPVSATTLLASTNSAMHDIGCSLCGKPIFAQMVPQSPAGSHFGPPPMHPHRGSNSTSSRFSLKPFFNTAPSVTGSPSAPINHASSPINSPIASPALGATGQITSVYIFRITKSQTQAGQAEKGDSKLYPLCRSGWCLERMRATCALWHFVRTGIIHVIWHGDDGTLVKSESNPQQDKSSLSSNAEPTISEKPSSSQRAPSPSPAPTATSAPPVVPTIAEEAKPIVAPPPLPARKKSSWTLGFTRGWKSGTGTSNTNSPPVSPGLGEHRDSIGSLGAEKDGSNGGLGLGAALDIDEKKVVTPEEYNEKMKENDGSDVPTIQEPVLESSSSPTSIGDLKPEEEQKDQEETAPKDEDNEESHQLQAPALSRAGSTASIPLSTTTDEAMFSTPKGDAAELPSDDQHEHGHQHQGDYESGKLQSQATSDEEGVEREHTPRPPHFVDRSALDDNESQNKDDAIELASPNPSSPIVSGTASPTSASPSGSKPPPIPRRAAARNRLSALNASSPTTPGSDTEQAQGREKDNNKEIAAGDAASGSLTRSRPGSADGSETDLSALRELADELDGANEGVPATEEVPTEIAGTQVAGVGSGDTGPNGDDVVTGKRPDEAVDVDQTERVEPSALSSTADEAKPRKKPSDLEINRASTSRRKAVPSVSANGSNVEREEEDAEEEPFTPVNLDEKFPPSPAYPTPHYRSNSSRPSSVSTTATTVTTTNQNASHPVPPPLPARHPKTPNMAQNQSHPPSAQVQGEGEKRFLTPGSGLEGEGWEEKAWKNVVRLKEDMWKARTGVVDEADPEQRH